LNLLLAVTAVDAERVQLQQLARVVLVHALGDVARVDQVHQHGRVAAGRLQGLAEAAAHMWADGVFQVAGQRGSDARLAPEDIEVVEPEPHQCRRGGVFGCGCRDGALQLGAEQGIDDGAAGLVQVHRCCLTLGQGQQGDARLLGPVGGEGMAGIMC
jgi:hypothetical protein